MDSTTKNSIKGSVSMLTTTISNENPSIEGFVSDSSIASNASWIKEQKKRIDLMSRFELCEIWRFAKPGHPYMMGGTELSDYFMEKWKTRGGFTPEISKALGW